MSMKRLREAAKADERFAHVAKDRRFRTIAPRDVKVKIDARFKPMLESDAFKSHATRDKYGRKIKKKKSDMADVYAVEDEGDESEDVERPAKKLKVKHEKPKKESSDDEEVHSESNEEEDVDALSYDEEESGELDMEDKEEEVGSEVMDESESSSDDDIFDEIEQEESDAEEIEHGEATKRLSVIDIDWERVRAKDIWVAFQSFLPPAGIIHSVVVYKSDLGKKMMQEEEEKGPPVFDVSERALDWDDPVNETVDERRVRKYLEQKRRWYFAIVTTDSKETANVLYAALDGRGVEAGREMDLRFVPDNISFEEREIKDQCVKAPGAAYTPSPALMHAAPLDTTGKFQSVEWDTTDPARLEVTMRQFNKDELNEADFQAYLASSSSELSEDGEMEKESRKAAYRDLIVSVTKDIQGDAEESEDEQSAVEDMEVTFTSGLEEQAHELVRRHKERLEKGEKTVFEQRMEKLAEKKRAKKEANRLKREAAEAGEHEGESEASIDFDDLDENGRRVSKKEDKKEKRKRGKKEAKALGKSRDAHAEADLDLLMFDPTAKEASESDEERNAGEKMSKRQRKKKASIAAKEEDVRATHKVLADDRFTKLFNDPRFTRDPTSDKFHKDAAANAEIQKERRRRLEAGGESGVDEGDNEGDDTLKRMVEQIKGRAKATPALTSAPQTQKGGRKDRKDDKGKVKAKGKERKASK